MTPEDDRLNAPLEAWRADVEQPPYPQIVDTETAIAVILGARRALTDGDASDLPIPDMRSSVE